MDQDKSQRRVKVTGEATHRTGTRHAAVKPHKRTTATDYKQLITSYMGGLKTGSLSQTYFGDTITKNAAALRANFGLAADDEPYLLCDPSGTGKAGMLLSSTGVHLADGKGTRIATSWTELAGTTVGYQRKMLVIGQNGVVTKDGQVMADLLKQLQAKTSK